MQDREGMMARFCQPLYPSAAILHTPVHVFFSPSLQLSLLFMPFHIYSMERKGPESPRQEW